MHLNKNRKYNAIAVGFLLPIMCVTDAARAGGEFPPGVQNLKKPLWKGEVNNPPLVRNKTL